ncbi:MULTISPECIES: nucleotidyltransferase family protein [Butyrivibrio]|uniref:Nucleotidyltransferase n=1 Tax=Butyrivibrio fibrisolvens TaxID=831 RepID=A0A317FWL0_BUTFI|nr:MULTISPECIES: nucleotidyltransferase family protein [Butyrivibrio]PWT26065.1 nucleotidyltransferase [Butyrivibrio fibrisolvens]SEQ40312.1 Nucleotidyl transferase [Butyrivibrio sp. TB]
MDKETLSRYTGTKDMNIVEAMQKIDENGKGILYILNSKCQLSGSVSDGDIRRWIITTGNLQGRVRDIMKKDPKCLSEEARDKAGKLMTIESVRSVPIVNEHRKIVDIVFIEDIHRRRRKKKQSLKGIPVIIMAGGKGTRLYPYTKILPKPLIPIGEIPILERIVNRFCSYGADEFYITVNYKKEMIKSYFKDLNSSYTIHYVEESKPLGTAGGISLIGDDLEGPVIVTNCDIMIEADYAAILEHHRTSGNAITIVSSLKNTIIPYGVLHTSEEGVVSSLDEKPSLSYLINTGMYVLDAGYLDMIPRDTIYNMTDLIDDFMIRGMQVGVFPISENSFLDMGQFEELRKMEERISQGDIND